MKNLSKFPLFLILLFNIASLCAMFFDFIQINETNYNAIDLLLNKSVDLYIVILLIIVFAVILYSIILCIWTLIKDNSKNIHQIAIANFLATVIMIISLQYAVNLTYAICILILFTFVTSIYFKDKAFELSSMNGFNIICYIFILIAIIAIRFGNEIINFFSTIF